MLCGYYYRLVRNPMTSTFLSRGAGLRAVPFLLSMTLGLAACGGGGGGGGTPATAPVSAPAPVTAPAPAAVQPPVITTQPAPQSVATGASATFDVAATGSDLHYQWRRDGADIAGATASRYTLDHVQPADDGAKFTVEVKNGGGAVTSRVVPLQVAGPNRLSLLAGQLGGPGGLDGLDARFTDPVAITVGPYGLLYVFDARFARSGSGRLRIVDPSTGKVTTSDTFSSTDSPLAIRFDRAGNRYDLARAGIFKTTATGVRTLFAGQQEIPYVDAPAVDGVGAAARFSDASDLAIDGAGNLYVADIGSRTIRKVDPAGKVSTLAGNGVKANVDGTGDKASFKGPLRLAIDRDGNLIVLDYPLDPTDPKLRKVAPDGTVTTLPLNDPANNGVVVRFGFNAGAMTFDAAGNLYVTDSYHGCQVRKIGPDGTVTDVAGAATVGYADGKGSAARFCANYSQRMESITADAAGNLFVLDPTNNVIRRVTPAGVVTTIAGRAPSGVSLDGTGDAAAFSYTYDRDAGASSVFDKSYSLVSDARGSLYVGAGDRIRKVTGAGGVATLPSAPAAAAGARYYPGGLGYGREALVVIDNVVSRMDADGALRFLAGSPGKGRDMADGKGANAVFHDPFDLIMDGLGNVYLRDAYVDAGRTTVAERRIAPDGTVTTRPAETTGKLTMAWYADKDGVLWTAHNDGTLAKTGLDGVRTTVSYSSPYYISVGTPTAITRDAAGNLYFATIRSAGDGWPGWSDVHRVTPNGAHAVIAGTQGGSGVKLGAPNSLGRVEALTIGADGKLIILSENALLQLEQ
jgi:hypothetical protein